MHCQAVFSTKGCRLSRSCIFEKEDSYSGTKLEKPSFILKVLVLKNKFYQFIAQLMFFSVSCLIINLMTVSDGDLTISCQDEDIF